MTSNSSSKGSAKPLPRSPLTMTDLAFLEALKALTINSSDPLRLFTSSPETTESASARLDDVIRKFRETGIKSSFPLGTQMMSPQRIRGNVC